METATTQFYSRRLTNDMRVTLISNIVKHIDTVFVKNPLYIESLETIKTFSEAFFEELYNSVPKEDFDVISKYDRLMDSTKIRISEVSDYYRKKEPNMFPYTSTGYFGDVVYFGPNYDDHYKLPICVHVGDVSNRTLNKLGADFSKKLFDTLNLNKCEKEKITKALKDIVQSATTTGKLVEAYPDMLKFIPEEWTKREQTSRKSTPTSVKSVGVDVNAFLK